MPSVFTKIYLVITMVLICSCGSVQMFNDWPETEEEPRNSDNSYTGYNGLCKADCLIQDKYGVITEEIPNYTGGENYKNIIWVEREIETKPSVKKWVKMKADKSCLSANPEDCLVWCLVDIPAQTRLVRMAIDTSHKKDFEMKEIERTVLFEMGGYTKSISVVCEEDLTEEFYVSIQRELKDRNYDIGDDYGAFDQRSKAALTKFQRDHELPIGCIDFQT